MADPVTAAIASTTATSLTGFVSSYLTGSNLQALIAGVVGGTVITPFVNNVLGWVSGVGTMISNQETVEAAKVKALSAKTTANTSSSNTAT